MITIFNKSCYTKKFLKEAVDFVLPKSLKKEDIILVVIRFNNADGVYQGEACCDDPFIMHVTIEVSDKIKFPDSYKYKNIKDSPVVVTNNKEELMISLLAHEFKHLAQFIKKSWDNKSTTEIELDAEKYALKMLRKWRKVYGH